MTAILTGKELRTCPFCGGKAEYHRAEITIKGRLTDSVTITCTKCHARSKRHLFDGTTLDGKEKAYANCAASWNRRV